MMNLTTELSGSDSGGSDAEAVAETPPSTGRRVKTRAHPRSWHERRPWSCVGSLYGIVDLMLVLVRLG
ncbi:hypothetical protein Dimus_033677, partial [Dionaea muscipula]